MTHRPRSHEIGSLAVSAVSHAWIKRGGAVDEVKNDYGEDLLVQTSLNGNMDSSRIWVQVKGREAVKRSAKGNIPSLRIPRGHVARWTNTADLVVIVLWDVSASIGWFCLPSERFNPYDLLISQATHVTLPFQPTDVFDSNAVELLAWIARANHTATATADARANERTMRDLEKPVYAQKAHEAAIATTFEFLIKLGLFSEDARPPEKFDTAVRNAYRRLGQDTYAEDFPDQETRFNGAVTLAILGHMESIQPSEGRGIIPFTLLGELADGVTDIYAQNHASLEAWLTCRQ